MNVKNKFFVFYLIFIVVVVEEMDEDDDDDGPMVSIGGARVPIQEVTDEMVAKMTPQEKEEYIRIGQEMYQDMYE